MGTRGCTHPRIGRTAGTGSRADGVEQASDGSLYISEGQTGKIWRVIYQSK